MATPNIVNVTSINGKNATATLANTSRTTAIDVAADKLVKVKVNHINKNESDQRWTEYSTPVLE